MKSSANGIVIRSSPRFTNDFKIFTYCNGKRSTENHLHGNKDIISIGIETAKVYSEPKEEELAYDERLMHLRLIIKSMIGEIVISDEDEDEYVSSNEDDE